MSPDYCVSLWEGEECVQKYEGIFGRPNIYDAEHKASFSVSCFLLPFGRVVLGCAASRNTPVVTDNAVVLFKVS